MIPSWLSTLWTGPNFNLIIACLHDQNKSGIFGGPAFNQPIRVIYKVLENL